MPPPIQPSSRGRATKQFIAIENPLPDGQDSPLISSTEARHPETPKELKRFRFLPTEIRLHIWNLAAPPRMVRFDPDVERSSADRDLIAVVGACQEPRSELRKRYELFCPYELVPGGRSFGDWEPWQLLKNKEIPDPALRDPHDLRSAVLFDYKNDVFTWGKLYELKDGLEFAFMGSGRSGRGTAERKLAPVRRFAIDLGIDDCYDPKWSSHTWDGLPGPDLSDVENARIRSNYTRLWAVLKRYFPSLEEILIVFGYGEHLPWRNPLDITYHDYNSGNNGMDRAVRRIQKSLRKTQKEGFKKDVTLKFMTTE